MKAAGRPTLVGGNIGPPVTAMVEESTPESWSVLEVSSFQLETVEKFKPQIAVVLNITPDHLDRHGTFEVYAAAEGADYGVSDGGRLSGAEWRGQADADGCGEDEGAGVLVQRAAADQAGSVCAWRVDACLCRARERRRSR